MKKIFYQPVFICFLLLSSFVLSAQVPDLSVKDYPHAVRLKCLKVTVNVVGNIATTTMEMQFFNNADRILEGELSFPLPEGVSVSRYAIDINGKMREAVPVDKQKGTEVFEEIEHRRVDPGLLEKTEGNNFKTRIYPLPVKGSRTVLIAYEEELSVSNKNAFHYSLPLGYQNTIDYFEIEVSILNTNHKPTIEESPDENFQFNNWENNYTAKIQKNNFIPGHSLQFSLPKQNDAPEVLVQKWNGQNYFLVNTFIEKKNRPKPLPAKISIIWDNSLSGLDRKIKAELELLLQYVQKINNVQIAFFTINNEFVYQGNFKIENGNCEALKNKIEKLTYDGGTNYKKIKWEQFAADELLFFTDGLSTLSNNHFSGLAKPIYTINSSPKADYSFLTSLAMKTGGAFINLNLQSIKIGLNYLSNQPLLFLGVKENLSVFETYPSIPKIVTGNSSVAGISLQDDVEITLQFGYGTTVEFEKKVIISYFKHQTNQANIRRSWAQKKMAELDLDYNSNKELITQLGKIHSIVTRGTSLIVLENIVDYVQYEIEPPAELREQYDALIKQGFAIRQQQRVEVIYRAKSLFDELLKWWGKEQKVAMVEPPQNSSSMVLRDSTVVNRSRRNNQVDSVRALDEVVVVGYGVQRKREITGSVSRVSSKDINAGHYLEGRASGLTIAGNSGSPGAATQVQDRALEEVVVIGKRNFGDDEIKIQNDDKAKQRDINIKSWSPERTYIKKLLNVKAEQRYNEYLLLRNDYLKTPAFYFDVACFFFQQKDTVVGARILSNLAELDFENHEVYKLLGYKLKETGQFEEEVYVFGKVLQWRLQEPQSYRDYALALADVGQYHQAVDTLYASLTKLYNSSVMGNYAGIEEII